MMTIEAGTAILAISGISICLMIRNALVFKLRRFMHGLVFDPHDGNGFQKRLEIVHRVPYDRMMWQFWKDVRLEAFYTKEEIDMLFNYREEPLHESV